MDTAESFIGPYRLLDTLGEGGMGVVYRAERAATGELVALKTVRLADIAMLASIRREIHELGRLRHPGVVRVSDDGVLDGLPWYAMEFIDGVTLRAYGNGHSAHETARYDSHPPSDGRRHASTADFGGGSRKDRSREHVENTHRRRPLLEVLSVVRRLCSALSYIHGEGIVHCDLKPDNILVLASDQPVLVDFGIASRFGGGFGRDVLEVDGSTAGTLAYMSPEQIRGDTVDARADLYALGCILYELLTGRPPFTGPTPVIVARAHQQLDPARPSTVAPDVPVELDELVMRLLEKDAGRRLGYADDVAARLARVGASNGWHAPRPRPYLYRPGFAGRREGLAQLTDRFVPAMDRPASVVFVGGESGIGKTRLMREVARAAERSGVRVLTGECSAPISGDASSARAGARLLEPLRGALLELIDRCTQRGKSEADRLLGARGPVLAEFEPRFAALPGQDAYASHSEPDANAARRRLFAALSDTFEALAANRPLLLILDDLQWMDELTLGFLEHVADDASRRVPPFGIFGTYRSDEVALSLARLIERPGVVRRELSRLADADVAAIIRDMLALDPAPESLCATLCRLSEGNPFFVAEYLRAAVEDGLLARDDGGRWRLAIAAECGPVASGLEQLSLPGTLLELIARRLDGLDGEVLAVAEGAAVLGREADAELLRATCGEDEAAIETAVAELVRRHVLEEAPGGLLRFTHEKIREVAYGRTAAERRSALHLAAATALSRSESLEQIHGVLGLHWERAGEFECARKSYLAGARNSARRFAFVESEQLYRAYLALRAEPSTELVEAMNELGHNVLRARGKVHDALAVQQQALGLALVLGDRRGEARSLRMAGLVLKELGELDRAEAQLTSALSIAVAEGDRESEESSCNYLAGMYYERGKPERALELYERAMAIARETGDERTEAMLLSNIAILHVESGRWPLAREAYEAASEIQTRVGDLNSLQVTLSNYAFLQAECGRFAEASALSGRALDAVRATRRRRFEGIVLSNMADLARDEGRPDDARSLCEQSLAIHEEVANRRWIGITYETLASIALAEGRLDVAKADAGRALEMHRALGNRGYEASALVLMAQIARRGGDVDAAASCLDAAQPAIEELGDPRILAGWLCERGHVAIARGEAARTVLEAVLGCTEGLGLDRSSRLGREIAQLAARIPPAG